jgi:hypothetical protein
MNLTNEEEAVRAAKEIENQLGVQESKILSQQEFNEEANKTPDWLDQNTESYIIKSEMYGDPELPMVKAVSDLMQKTDTPTQVHFEQSEYTFYICPTTNNFPSVQKVLP